MSSKPLSASSWTLPSWTANAKGAPFVLLVIAQIFPLTSRVLMKHLPKNVWISIVSLFLLAGVVAATEKKSNEIVWGPSDGNFQIG